MDVGNVASQNLKIKVHRRALSTSTFDTLSIVVGMSTLFQGTSSLVDLVRESFPLYVYMWGDLA